MDGQPQGNPVFYGTQPSPALSFNHWVEHTNAQPPSPDLFSDTAVDEDFWTSHQPNPQEADTIPVPQTPPIQYRPPMLDLSNVWHSKRRQLFSPEPSIQDNNKLWTFVYRGQPPRFERGTRVNHWNTQMPNHQVPICSRIQRWTKISGPLTNLTPKKRTQYQSRKPHQSNTDHLCWISQ
ncbi:hypothetical protein T265_16236, partial [Opisthorchis viverrini]